MDKSKKDIQYRSKLCAVRIIKLANKLPRTTAGFVLAEQLIKSGTSVGANTVELKMQVLRRILLAR